MRSKPWKCAATNLFLVQARRRRRLKVGNVTLISLSAYIPTAHVRRILQLQEKRDANQAATEATALREIVSAASSMRVKCTSKMGCLTNILHIPKPSDA